MPYFLSIIIEIIYKCARCVSIINTFHTKLSFLSSFLFCFLSSCMCMVCVWAVTPVLFLVATTKNVCTTIVISNDEWEPPSASVDITHSLIGNPAWYSADYSISLAKKTFWLPRKTQQPKYCLPMHGNQPNTLPTTTISHGQSFIDACTQLSVFAFGTTRWLHSLYNHRTYCIFRVFDSRIKCCLNILYLNYASVVCCLQWCRPPLNWVKKFGQLAFALAVCITSVTCSMLKCMYI